MSRAGLVALFLFALANCIALVACAPLPAPATFGNENAASFVQRRHLDLDIRATTPLPPHVGSSSGVEDITRVGSASHVIAPAQSARVQLIERELEDDAIVLVRRESIGDKIKHAFQHIGEKIKGAFQHVGNKIKEGFQKFGQKVKEGFHKVKDAFVHVGHKIKEGFVKVGHAIKHAAQKVGAWMKDTGAKIVKVALKVASVVHKAIGKVVGWIPGIGKPLGKIFDATSHGLSAASDAIHAHLGGKLDDAMHKMNKGLHVMKFIP
jgi:Flp pilus assembly pilin Flp